MSDARADLDDRIGKIARLMPAARRKDFASLSLCILLVQLRMMSFLLVDYMAAITTDSFLSGSGFSTNELPC